MHIKKTTDRQVILYVKINLKWIIVLHVRVKTTKLTEKSIRENICVIRLDKNIQKRQRKKYSCLGASSFNHHCFCIIDENINALKRANKQNPKLI